MKCPDTLRCEGCLETCSSAVCEHCHWTQGTPPKSPHYLRPGTILQDYWLARVLGSGGFGITYLAWDCNLKCKVAIKEYFPVAYSVRAHDHSTVVTNHDHDSKDAFDYGLNKFLEEGQALARFNGFPGIASVRTFLTGNGTSYLVLDYQDGITLQQHVTDAPKRRIGYKEAVDLLMPVMDTLREVHAAGILHRDISPDNIQINSHGQVKLLDFGSAKHHAPQTEHTKMLVHKIGYSPEEQCRTAGKQGYWTDVYALGATLYFAITGQKPPDSLNRLAEDDLVPPSKLGIPIPPRLEGALLKALAVRAPDRFQTVRDFQDAVMRALPAPVPIPEPPKTIPLQEWFKKTCARSLLAAESLKFILQKYWQEYGIIASLTFAVTTTVVGIVILALWLAAVPKITQFSVQPIAIRPGESANLQWSVKGGSVSISPSIGNEPASGSRSISPLVTTSYTLTAQARLRAISRSVKVVVVPRATANLKADPSNIVAGQSAELTWEVSGEPKSIVIKPEIGNLAEKHGRRQVFPNATTTYTLEVVDSDGTTANADATVSVAQDSTTPITPSPEPVVAAKPIVALSLQKSPINVGETTILRWSVSGSPMSISLNGSPVPSRGSRSVSPNQSTIYRLSARNAAGISAKTITLTILGPPQVVFFRAEPAVVTPSQQFLISWSVVGQLNSVTFDSQKVTPAGSKMMKAPSVPAFTRYMLLARGPGGVTTAYVNVQTVSPKVKPW